MKPYYDHGGITIYHGEEKCPTCGGTGQIDLREQARARALRRAELNQPEY